MKLVERPNDKSHRNVDQPNQLSISTTNVIHVK